MPRPGRGVANGTWPYSYDGAYVNSRRQRYDYFQNTGSRMVIRMNSDTETTLSAVTKMHVLDVMLGSVKEDGEWAVLLLDKFTTRIMSNICGISDLLDYGVSRASVAVKT